MRTFLAGAGAAGGGASWRTGAGAGVADWSSAGLGAAGDSVFAGAGALFVASGAGLGWRFFGRALAEVLGAGVAGGVAWGVGAVVGGKRTRRPCREPKMRCRTPGDSCAAVVLGVAVGTKVRFSGAGFGFASPAADGVSWAKVVAQTPKMVRKTGSDFFMGGLG